MKVQGPEQLVGQAVVDSAGCRVGVIRQVLCADGDPYRAQWAVVTLGPWRARPRLVPVGEARHHPRGIQLTHRRTTVVASPRVRSQADDLRLHEACAFYQAQRQ